MLSNVALSLKKEVARKRPKREVADIFRLHGKEYRGNVKTSV